MASETSSDDMRRRKGGGAVPRGASSAPSGDAKGTVTAHGYPRGRVTAGAIWRFGRPHTIIGTTISIISVTACALDTTEQMTLAPVVAALGLAIATSLLMNVYIVGLNQMTDVAIDRINKPKLPVASGELTIAQGWRIVYASAVLSVGSGYLLGTTPLLWTLLASMFLGTVYSVEPIRLKKYPVFAAFCILAVRGVIVQFGFYHHIRDVLEANDIGAASPEAQAGFMFGYPPRHVFAVVFVTVFSVVIALFKDLPDAEGDAKHGVKTLTVRMGVGRVFRVCAVLLAADYVLGAYMGLYSQSQWSLYLTCGVHLAMLAVVVVKAAAVDVNSHASITAFYMHVVWKLFYAEYLLLPFFVR